MLVELLKEIEKKELGDMLDSGRVSDWNSFDITFHAPRIERVWRPYKGSYRINLHVIYPCDKKEALYHPHAWPAAIHIVKGNYSMLTGYGSGIEKPPHAYYFDLSAGTYYEMIHPDAWHAEFPQGGPALTISVSGKPWPRIAPKSPYPVAKISESRKSEILTLFAQALRVDQAPN